MLCVAVKAPGSAPLLFDRWPLFVHIIWPVKCKGEQDVWRLCGWGSGGG